MKPNPNLESIVFITLFCAISSLLTPQNGKAKEYSIQSPEISGSTVITKPFEDFFHVLENNINIKEKLLTHQEGNKDELLSISNEIKSLPNLLKKVSEIVFQIFISILKKTASLITN